MQHFLDDRAIALKIDNHILADGRTCIAITKGIAGSIETGTCIKSRDYGTFLCFFPTSGRPSALNRAITFSLGEGMIDQISERIGLVFEPGTETGGNVCFANSPELRDDFKISFSAIDVLNYIQGILSTTDRIEKYKESPGMDLFVLPYPNNSTDFWE